MHPVNTVSVQLVHADGDIHGQTLVGYMKELHFLFLLSPVFHFLFYPLQCKSQSKYRISGCAVRARLVKTIRGLKKTLYTCTMHIQ